MDRLLYECSLCAALSLMLFFGVYFMFAKRPDKHVFDNYIRSRKIMGAALLLLSANYLVHLFCSLRFTAPGAAILLNLSTYYLAAWLFSSALTSLLDSRYLTRRRFILNMAGWLCFTVVAGAVLAFFPKGAIGIAGITVMTAWFLAYAFRLATRLIRTYRNAVRLFDETQSDHIAAYVDWLSVFTWWAVIYGVGCGLFTFIPDKYVFIWILSSIPFYIYLYCSYMNYMVFYEKVETALEDGLPEGMEQEEDVGQEARPPYHADIEKRLAEWIRKDGYTHPGLTIGELAATLCTNRTYLAGYIKSTYRSTFREWIAGLRIGFAKRLMSEHPELTIGAVSEASGFLSMSYFSKVFTAREGVSPARWRNSRLD